MDSCIVSPSSVPGFSIRSYVLTSFVLHVLPIAIATIVYARFASRIWFVEITVLVFWAFLALRVSSGIGYFAFGAQSASYPGAVAELRNNGFLFLGTATVLGGWYSAAGALRDRPLRRWALVATVPFGQLGMFAVYALVIV